MDLKQTLTERGTTHGDFSDNSRISQEIKYVIRENGVFKLTLYQAEALDMIAHKISRILAGDPFEPDHWKDIAGYAMLVHDRVIKEDNKDGKEDSLRDS